MTHLARTAADLIGAELSKATRLHGGDLSEVVRLHVADGRTFVAKSGDRSRAEAEMLMAIGEAGVPAPSVVAVSDEVLVLEDLGEDEGPGSAWGDLGRVLRRLHGIDGSAPGWPRDHAFGPVAIPNGAAGSWPSFWAEHRLLPSCPHCPADLARRIERLAMRVCDLLPDDPVLSLLHGDLWSGNIMVRSGRVTGLIDPACYYGHAEVDLAMLTLFGTPGPEFWSAYGALEPGIVQRRPIYQLWPALVHLRLFGGAYRGLVEMCLDAVE